MVLGALTAAPAPAGPEELVRLFIILAVMLFAGKLSSEAFDRLGQPAVLGELLAGALLGVGALGVIPTDPADPLSPVLRVLAEIGVVILLFEIGLETELRQLLRVGPAATAVALAGVALPFVATFFYWISPLAAGAFNLAPPSTTAVFLGAAVTATSVGITARVLADLHILRSTEAQLILGAAVLDDVLGLVLLGLVATLAAGASVGAGDVAKALGVALGFLGLAIGAGMLVVPRIFGRIDRMRVRGVLLVSAFGFALLVAALAQLAGSAMIIGAFAAGIILSGTSQRAAIEASMKPVADIFTPVFFLSVGAHLDLRTLNLFSPAAWPVLGVGAMITVIAALGKLASGWAVPWRPFNRVAVGLGMMPRGEVGLIFANLGLSQGVLSAQLFSALTLMVIATTFLAPPLLKWSIRRRGVAPAEPAAGEPAWHPPEQAE